MERLDSEVKEYEYLAQYYDYLLGDEEAFELWLKYILENKFNNCLELASGSGVMAKILEEKGYDVIASDISNSMKEVAKKNFNGEYLILNMSNFNINKKFDLILCICDSINYLYKEELDSMFKCCFEHLNDNGRLIFDIHNPERLNEFKEEYIEEGKINDDVFYQWTINSDISENVINEHFTFYTPNGMIQEHHTQNVFAVETIKNKLQDSFFNVRIIEDFVEKEKILFIGTKNEEVV